MKRWKVNGCANSEASEAGQEVLVVCSYKYPALAVLPSDHVGPSAQPHNCFAILHKTGMGLVFSMGHWSFRIDSIEAVSKMSGKYENRC